MKTPKQRFIEKHGNTAVGLLTDPMMLRSCETALLQMTYNQMGVSDMAEAARNQFKLEGARSFMYELLNLCTVEPPRTKTTKDNLEP